MAKKSAIKGGTLFGDSHSDPSGGIKTINVDTNDHLLVEGGEVVINKNAVKKHWKKLNEINTSTGGNPIAKPIDGVGKDGGVIPIKSDESAQQTLSETKELLTDYIGKHSFKEFFSALKRSNFGAFAIDYSNAIKLIGLVPNADKANEILAKKFYANNRILAKGKRDEFKKEVSKIKEDQFIDKITKMAQEAENKMQKDIAESDLKAAKDNLAKGIEVEKEHLDTLNKVASGEISVHEAVVETAQEHISEDPKYYDKLENSKFYDSNLEGYFKNKIDSSVKTNDILFKEAENLDGGLQELMDKLPIETIPIEKIVPTQEGFLKDRLDAIKGDIWEYPLLVKIGEFYYVEDGHHRIIKSIIENKPVVAKVFHSSSTTPIYELTEEINIGDEGMWHGANRRVKGLDDLGNVSVVELDENDNEIGDMITVRLESLKKEFRKFPSAKPSSFSIPLYKKGDKVSMFDNEPVLEVVEVNEWADKLPTYDLRSEDGSIVRNNISETKLTPYENKVSEALIKHDKMVDAAKKQERLINIGEENIYKASKYLRDLIDEQVAIYEADKRNKFVKVELDKLLSIYFNEIVSKNPTLLFDFLKDQKDIPSAIKVMAQYAVEVDFSQEFKSNLKDNIWKLIPEEYKEYSLPKKINYSPEPDDKNLASILSPFTSSDTLRLNLMGVRFDKEGIAATDAHKMIFLAHPDEEREAKTYCMDKDCLKENAVATLDKKRENIEELRYPNYRAVVPDNKNYVSIYTESLIAYLSTVIKIKYFNSVVKQVFIKFDSEQEFAFNSIFLLEGAKTMYKLGYEQIDISYSTPNRAIVLCPKGQIKNIYKLATDFVLIMPVMMSFGGIVDFTDGVMFFNAESECVQTKSIEDKSCLNPIVVQQNKIDEKLKKIDDFEAKEKEREAKRIADEAKKIADIIIPEPEPLIEATPIEATPIVDIVGDAIDEKEEWNDALSTLKMLSAEDAENTEWIEAIETLELLLGDKVMADGGTIKYYDKDNAHRLGRPNGSIEKDILNKVEHSLSGLTFAGNFGWKTPNGKLGDGYLYNLDAFDTKLVKDIKLKDGEKIFRYINRMSAIGGMTPMIKINLNNGILYFMVINYNNDDIVFETKGVKAEWVGLTIPVMADGGTIKTLTESDIKVGAKFKNKNGTILVIDSIKGGVVKSSIENKKEKYQDELAHLFSFLNLEGSVKVMAAGGTIEFDDNKYSGLLFKYNDLYEKHEKNPSDELKQELDITEEEIHRMERAGDYDKEIMESQFGK